MKILSNGYTGQAGPVLACEPKVYRFDHRGVRFAFDPNSLKLAMLDDGETEEDLANFAIPLKPNFPFGSPPAPGAICFDMTRACPLACSYCFAQHDDERDKNKHLTFEEAVEGLVLTLPLSLRTGKMPNHRIEFSFFGGEPLLRWDLIEKLVHHIKCWLPCRHHFHVTTNAVLMTDEIADFLEEHQFSAIVSLDGTEKAHNECRVRKDGSGTYSAVMRGLEILKKRAPSVVKSLTLRSTFTPTSIDTEGVGERVAHLNDLVAQGYASYVSVEPAFLGESTCIDRGVVEAQNLDYTKFREKWQTHYDRASDIWLERLKADKPVFFHHFISFTKRLVNSLPNCSECGAAKGYFTIAPGGELYACHHEGGTRVGSIHTGGIDHELTASWQDNRYYARINCPDCVIRNMCGGGCREYSVACGLGTSMPVPSECELKWILFRANCWLMSQTLPGPELRKKVMAYWGMNQRNSCGAPRGRS